MLFALICTDRPNRLDLRLATRPAHKAYLADMQSRIACAGPLLGADDKPVGSLIIVEANDRAEAEAFAAGDPYSKAGLFESVVIRPCPATFRDDRKPD